MFKGYVRCGNESGQCIRSINRCNGVIDCTNGWDEEKTTCFSEKEQIFFTSNSIFLTILADMLRVYMLHNKERFFFYLDRTFFVTVLPTGSMTLYDDTGEVETFQETSCPCTVMLRETQVLGVKATTDGFKGFIL